MSSTSISSNKLSRLIGTANVPLKCIALQPAAPAYASDATTNKTILFICQHGSVKSQMAAAHFNRIARGRGLHSLLIAWSEPV